MNKKLWITFIILCIIGFITSLYLTVEHYLAGKKPCDITPTVSCSLVNSSIYSEILGIPVAIFGMFWFVGLFVLAWNRYKNPEKKHGQRLLYWNVSGIIAVTYFIYAEVMLKALCPFCTLVHAIVLLTLILSIYCYNYKIEIK